MKRKLLGPANKAKPSQGPKAADQPRAAPAGAQQTGGGHYMFTALDAQNGTVISEVARDPLKLAGTSSPHVASMLIEQIAATVPRCKQNGLSKSLEEMCQSLEALSPKTTLEALLCAQMLGVHNLAMEHMRRSLLSEQTIEGVTTQTNRVVRLLRVFVEQTDALQRLRGNAGQQKVTVEHVHVHEGGQAIVGTVGAPGTERGVGDGTANE